MRVLYFRMPAVGEPAGAALMAVYPDTEFDTEFNNGSLAAATKTYVNSIWTGANTGPLYKWVRINAATKQSLNINVDNTVLAAANPSTPVYYDQAPIPPSI